MVQKTVAPDTHINESPADRLKRENAERSPVSGQLSSDAAQGTPPSPVVTPDHKPSAPNQNIPTDDEDPADTNDDGFVDPNEQVNIGTPSILAGATAPDHAEDGTGGGTPQPITPGTATEAETEDPEVLAERKRRFERAEAFEKKQEGIRAGTIQSDRPRFTPTGDATNDQLNAENQADYAARKHTGMEKLHKISQHLNSSTPDEHTLFGVGGVPFTVGDLRGIVGLPSSRM